MQDKATRADKTAQYTLDQAQALVGCDQKFISDVLGKSQAHQNNFYFKDLVVLSTLKFAKDLNVGKKLLGLLTQLIEVIEEQSEPFENPFRTDFLSNLSLKDLNAEILGQPDSNIFLHPKSPKVMMTVTAGERLIFSRFFTLFNEKPLTSRIANNLQIIYPADESAETEKIFVKATKDHQFAHDYEAECPVAISIDLNKIHSLIVKRIAEL